MGRVGFEPTKPITAGDLQSPGDHHPTSLPINKIQFVFYAERINYSVYISKLCHARGIEPTTLTLQRSVAYLDHASP